MLASEHWMVVASARAAIEKQLSHPMGTNQLPMLTKKLLKDCSFVEKCANSDTAFLKGLLEQLEDGVLLGHYLAHRKENVFAIIEQLCKPTFFLALSMPKLHKKHLLEVTKRVERAG